VSGCQVRPSWLESCATTNNRLGWRPAAIDRSFAFAFALGAVRLISSSFFFSHPSTHVTDGKLLGDFFFLFLFSCPREVLVLDLFSSASINIDRSAWFSSWLAGLEGEQRGTRNIPVSICLL
jgi:hypothetical protein